MNKSPKNDLPWELIAESLTGSLSVEEEIQLQRWISSSSENKEKYLHIKELWTTGMEDYRFYRMANEEESWKTLHAKMRKVVPEQTESRLIQGQFHQSRKFVRNLVAIAAVFIGFTGIGIWFVLPKNPHAIYETAFNVQKRVNLGDGSVITLQPNTKIEVPASYNKSGRTIIMGFGEARFDVMHNPGKSFVVELGSTQIKDIGTSFIIHKKPNSIDVAVSTGKIAFVKISTRETKELKAGFAVTFNVQHESFGNIKAADSMNAARQLLVFKNTPLSEVIANVQKVYGKKIIINEDIAKKTFTGQLDGMSFKGVIKVICTTYRLEYEKNDSVYILKAKTIEQP
jgi:ferric-dicitrate binding protein FerR (iron transport regulator)